ncbi:F0F1 ATP synthase subunit delta [Microbacterium sp. NPDC057659]|uniref:F0F1 ATP synthase subunit delta n=1 Tax=Microbacterium sp. NPDC057659 TaxID=3346198 RepID=UPI0036701736
MGSATTQALETTANALASTKGITVDVAGELFAVARLVDESVQLSGALADPSVPAEARAKVASDVFAQASEPTREVLRVAVSQRWSSAADLVDGIEELAVRAAAIGEPNADLSGELFAVTRVIADNPELELALGSRLGDSAAKGGLVERVLGGSTSPATELIVSSLVRQPRERRVRQLLSRAMSIVAAQRGAVVATVQTASPLSAEQQTRLSQALTRRYGSNVSLNVVVDPTVVGGLRVQVADDVIDGSISARLADLRQKLAG